LQKREFTTTAPTSRSSHGSVPGDTSIYRRYVPRAVPPLSGETLYLALGHAVIWEGDATHYVDDITVESETQ